MYYIQSLHCQIGLDWRQSETANQDLWFSRTYFFQSLSSVIFLKSLLFACTQFHSLSPLDSSDLRQKHWPMTSNLWLARRFSNIPISFYKASQSQWGHRLWSRSSSKPLMSDVKRFKNSWLWQGLTITIFGSLVNGQVVMTSMIFRLLKTIQRMIITQPKCQTASFKWRKSDRRTRGDFDRERSSSHIERWPRSYLHVVCLAHHTNLIQRFYQCDCRFSMPDFHFWGRGFFKVLRAISLTLKAFGSR